MTNIVNKVYSQHKACEGMKSSQLVGNNVSVILVNVSVYKYTWMFICMYRKMPGSIYTKMFFSHLQGTQF